jgi:tetratricopeptide (TPR) repeat protein
VASGSPRPLGQSSAANSSTQARKKASDAQSTALTPDQREAQKHYRIALEAIQNNDLSTAIEELKSAADLAPKNALIRFNLAVVESKRGDSVSALADLQTASKLGIPAAQQNDADELEAKLTYGLRQEELSNKLKDVFGSVKGVQINTDCGQPYHIISAANWSVHDASISLFKDEYKTVNTVISANNYVTNTEHFTATYSAKLADLSPEVNVTTEPGNDAYTCTFYQILITTSGNKDVIAGNEQGIRSQRFQFPGQQAGSSETPWGPTNYIGSSMSARYFDLNDASRDAQLLSQAIRLTQGKPVSPQR